MTLKTCTKCLEEKPLSDFYKLSKSKDGHRPDCKDCHKNSKKSFYNLNKDRLLQYQKKFYNTNIKSKYDKIYNQINKEIRKELQQGS